MSSLRSFRLPILLAFALVFQAAAIAGELRTWSDKSGKHKIEAEFVEVLDGNARLQKSDGTMVSIPLGKLSKGDQQHLRELVRGASSNGNSSNGGYSGNRRSNGYSFSYSEQSVNGSTTTERSFSYQRGSGGEAAADKKPKRRTWSDASGKHKIEATFMELDDGKVRLRRSDGKVIAIPLTKLSKVDQAEAKKLSAGFASKRSDPNDPFGDQAIDAEYSSGSPEREPGEFLQGDIVEAESFGKLKRGTVVSSDDHWINILFDGEDRVDTVSRMGDKLRMIRANPDAVARSSSGQVLTKPDYSNVQQVMLGTQDSSAFKPDPLPAERSSRRMRSVRLGGKRGFFERLESLAVSSNGEFGMVSYVGGADVHSESGRIQVCNLLTGKVREITEIPTGFKLAEVSPTGMRIAALNSNMRHDDKTVDLYEIDNNELTHTVSWQPFKEEMFNDVEDIVWLGDNRLATVGRNTLTVWEVGGARAIYTLSLNGMSHCVLSPGLKQLAVADSKMVYVLDVATGDPLQEVKLPQGRRHKALAFDPSGRLLAGLDGNQLDLMNLETGELFDTLYIPQKGSTLCWADEEHVLVGGKSLVHVPSQMTIWNYQHTAAKTAHAAGINWFLLSSNQVQTLMPLKLPHPGVKPIADSEVVLKPGDAVALEVQLISNFSQGGTSILEETRKKLTTELEAAGYVVAENAPAVLVARNETGQNREMLYGDWGIRRNAPEKVSVTEQIYTLDLQIDGKSVWQRRQIQGPPHLLRTKQGENTQQAVARVMQPSANFFGRGIPGRILPSDKMSARSSKITANGIR